MKFTRSGKDARERYFQEEFTKETFVHLANLHRFNLESRRHIAVGISNAIYKPLERREGDLANLDESARQELLSLTTLDILSKVFMALEDLGKIMLAARRPLRAFPDVLRSAKQSESLSIFQELSSKPEKELFYVFYFWEPERYGVTEGEAAVLNDYYFRTVNLAKKFFAFIGQFIERHKLAYNKYKHGMPILLGLEGPPPAEGVNGVVPIFTTPKDSADMEFILVGSKVVEKLIGLLSSAVDFSKVLVARRLQLAEHGGVPLPVLCEMRATEQRTEYRPWTFGSEGKELEEKLTAILKGVLAQLERTAVTVNLNVQTNQKKLEEWVAFYLRDWKIA